MAEDGDFDGAGIVPAELPGSIGDLKDNALRSFSVSGQDQVFSAKNSMVPNVAQSMDDADGGPSALQASGTDNSSHHDGPCELERSEKKRVTIAMGASHQMGQERHQPNFDKTPVKGALKVQEDHRMIENDLEFELTVNREFDQHGRVKKPLGLSFTVPSEIQRTLLVTEITPHGLIWQHNVEVAERGEHHKIVEVNVQIVGVNDTDESDPMALANALRSTRGHMTLRLRRVPPALPRRSISLEMIARGDQQDRACCAVL